MAERAVELLKPTNDLVAVQQPGDRASDLRVVLDEDDAAAPPARRDGAHEARGASTDDEHVCPARLHALSR